MSANDPGPVLTNDDLTVTCRINDQSRGAVDAMREQRRVDLLAGQPEGVERKIEEREPQEGVPTCPICLNDCELGVQTNCGTHGRRLFSADCAQHAAVLGVQGTSSARPASLSCTTVASASRPFPAPAADAGCVQSMPLGSTWCSAVLFGLLSS